jgi:uncharacterized protein YndB with AHSA1/START domain
MGPVTAFLARTVIAAPPERVWEAVGDPARMARWSPEVVAVRVIGRPRRGARTLNLNRRGAVVWPTSSVLVDYEPGRRIAWRVAASGTLWSLDLAPGAVEGTTALLHRRELLGPTRPLSARLFAPLIGGLDHHDVELADGMHRTLAAIEADLRTT